MQVCIDTEVLETVHRNNREIDQDHPLELRDNSSQVIDISDRSQVMRWSRYFGTTPLQLCNAVHKVGSNAMVVQRLLRAR
jgi:hypothetical protein